MNRCRLKTYLDSATEQLVDHRRRKQMYISAIYDFYIAILDYMSIKHLCPILEGIFHFCLSLLEILVKTEKKKCLTMVHSRFLHPYYVVCKKKNKQRQESVQFKFKMLVQENVATDLKQLFTICLLFQPMCLKHGG